MMNDSEKSLSSHHSFNRTTFLDGTKISSRIRCFRSTMYIQSREYTYL